MLSWWPKTEKGGRLHCFIMSVLIAIFLVYVVRDNEAIKQAEYKDYYTLQNSEKQNGTFTQVQVNGIVGPYKEKTISSLHAASQTEYYFMLWLDNNNVISYMTRDEETARSLSEYSDSTEQFMIQKKISTSKSILLKGRLRKMSSDVKSAFNDKILQINFKADPELNTSNLIYNPDYHEIHDERDDGGIDGLVIILAILEVVYGSLFIVYCVLCSKKKRRWY